MERVQDITGHLISIQGALPKPTQGALAVYSPPRAQPASNRRDTYASQLAEHQQAFQDLQDLQDLAALEESDAEAGVLPLVAVEKGLDTTAHQLAQPSSEVFSSQHNFQPHASGGQVQHDPASGSASVGTIVTMQSATVVAHHPEHQHAQHNQQLPVSPNATTRPFHAFLGSADKKRHMVYRAPAVASGYVYVPEVGLVKVVPLGELAVQPRGEASGVQSFVGRLDLLGVQASQAASVSVALDGAGANAVQDAAPRAQSSSLQPSLPQLRVLRSMQQFWKLWAIGDEFNGKGPLRDWLPEIIARKRQRYSEWKRAAEVVECRVAKLPSSSSAGPSPTALSMVLEQLERERGRQSMATFIKAMGKELKEPQAELGTR